MFDFLKPKPKRRMYPYDIADPRGRSYIKTEEDEGWFKWWMIIPILLILVAILAVLKVGPFAPGNMFGGNETVTQIVCGDDICQSQYENINTCPQDCDPTYEGKEPFTLWGFIKGNWVALLIIGAVVYWFFFRKKSEFSDEKAPKIYTLEECRKTAEEVMKNKGFDNYLPTFHYMNRPDLYAYRYMYKEEKYPGINSHEGGGFKEHSRGFFMIEVTYDNQLNYFEFTTNEDKALRWIEEKIGAGTKSAMREYRLLREKSERPITRKEQQIREDQERYGDLRPEDEDYYRRPGPRDARGRYYGYEER